MKKVHQRTHARNRKLKPTRLSWDRDTINHNPDRAAQRIAARFGLSLAHAAVVARLAGLGTEVS